MPLLAFYRKGTAFNLSSPCKFIPVASCKLKASQFGDIMLNSEIS